MGKPSDNVTVHAEIPADRFRFRGEPLSQPWIIVTGMTLRLLENGTWHVYLIANMEIKPDEAGAMEYHLIEEQAPV